MNPETAWRVTLGELEMQMTTATFNTWLKDAQLLTVQEDTWTISVRNDFARDWLQTRLHETIRRTLQTISGNKNIKLTFTTQQPDPAPVPDTVEGVEAAKANEALTLQSPTPPPDPPPFPGFESFRSNFVQMPMQFFEIIIPAGPPRVAALVAQVAKETIGHVVNWKTGERREWWPATNEEIAHTCGFALRHVTSAVYLARLNGYILQHGKRGNFQYRLRFHDDPFDQPDPPQKRPRKKKK